MSRVSCDLPAYGLRLEADTGTIEREGDAVILRVPASRKVVVRFLNTSKQSHELSLQHRIGATVRAPLPRNIQPDGWLDRTVKAEKELQLINLGWMGRRTEIEIRAA